MLTKPLFKIANPFLKKSGSHWLRIRFARSERMEPRFAFSKCVGVSADRLTVCYRRICYAGISEETCCLARAHLSWRRLASVIAHHLRIGNSRVTRTHESYNVLQRLTYLSL